jgi:hypothetical protein
VGRSSVAVNGLRFVAVVALIAGLGAAAARSPAAPLTVTDCVTAGGQAFLPAGVYTTLCFLPGMKITVPPGGLRRTEDTAGELELIPRNGTNTE